MNHSPFAPDPVNATVIDPVCGMTVDPATAAGSSEYGGQTYHFCSRGCEAKFDAAPARYAPAAAAPAPSASCCAAAPAPSTSCCAR